MHFLQRQTSILVNPLQEEDDVKHECFVRLKLPNEYCLSIPQQGKLKKESGLLAFVCLLDFCLWVESIILQIDNNVVYV